MVPSERHPDVAALEDEEEEENRASANAATSAWLNAIGGWTSPSGDHYLPETEFDPELGYGWKEMAVEQTREVYLQVRPRGTGLGVWLSIEGDETDDFIPQDHGVDITAISLSKREGWKVDFVPLTRPLGWEFYLLFWPEWIGDIYAHRRPLLFDPPQARGIIGLVERDWVEWTGERLEGWLDDAESRDVAAILFGGDPEVRFVPVIAQAEHVAVPCKPDTIAGALLRNLAVDGDMRVISQLLQRARVIADGGIAYHQAVLAAHQSMIDNL